LGWGTLGCLFIGLFAEGGDAAPKAGLFMGGDASQLIAQIKGILAVGVYTVVVSSICWLVIKYTIGLRPTEDVEREGLDTTEHGECAYEF
jgi:Amt family ammonium transporter